MRAPFGHRRPPRGARRLADCLSVAMRQNARVDGIPQPPEAWSSMNPWPLVAADLGQNRAGAVAIVLLVALAVALGVAVSAQERALREGSARGQPVPAPGGRPRQRDPARLERGLPPTGGARPRAGGRPGR